MCSTLEHCP
jgi:hypothetical protein